MIKRENGTTRPRPAAAQVPIPLEDGVPEAADRTCDTRPRSKSVAPRSRQRKSRANGNEKTDRRTFPPLANAALCLFVAPDGEFPRLEVFADLPQLTARMRELEGQDVVALPMYGVPLPITRGPHRFFYLPNGEPYPVFDLAPLGEFVPNSTGLPPIDPTYYLGPESIHETASATVVDHRKPTPTKEQTDERTLQEASHPAAEDDESSDRPTRPCASQEPDLVGSRPRPCVAGVAG
jgi:hypothetical protein